RKAVAPSASAPSLSPSLGAMADDEKLISDAFHQAFKKTASIPSQFYAKMTHELEISQAEPLKVNLSMKRGLVLDIEDDSMFRSFLTIGDIVLTINDKVACRADFKLTEAFKDRGGKTVTFVYIRLRNYSPEEPPLEQGERRDHYEYKVAIIYCLQRMNLGMVMEGLNNRVYITGIQPKSLGSLCAAVGDVILHVNGRRVMDTEKATSQIMEELESRSYCKITLERASYEEARAHVQYTITKNRDLPMPADCVDYIEKAIGAMKGPEPKPILRAPRQSVTEAEYRVAFHDRITTESVIPSDIQDEALIRTPDRVPGQPKPPASTPQYTESVDRTTEASVTKQVSVHEANQKDDGPIRFKSKEPVKSTNRKGKGSSKKTGGEPQGKSKESVGRKEKTSSMMSSESPTTATSTMTATPSSPPTNGRSLREWRKRLSTEIFFGRNRKKSGGSGGTLEAVKNKKKKGKKDHTNTNTSNDTEGNQ
ncbi:hypothetical protein PENTCL1PPCAC_3137, partial [Pristionchus entomophagus]